MSTEDVRSRPGDDAGGPPTDAVERRAFLSLALTGIAGATLAGCGGSTTDAPAAPVPRAATRPATGRNRILLAYFSRPGENYHYGGRRNLRRGNTDILAGLIRVRLRCDVDRIVPADPYPQDYEETVELNRQEQAADFRPRIRGPLRSIDRYDTVLLASPIWSTSTPMIMRTFAERFDFTGKTVFPVVTHAVSGLGTAADDYASACDGAEIGRGLAVQGERVRDAGPAVDRWLRTTRLRTA